METTKTTTCLFGAMTENPCGRPVDVEGLHSFEDPGLCPEHLAVREADDEAADWLRAYEELSSRMTEVLDPEHLGHLETLTGDALEKARRETARAYVRIEVAKRVAEHMTTDRHADKPPLGLEEIEEGHRLFLRSDRLTAAYYALDKLPADALAPEMRWTMLGVLAETAEQASEELDRFKAEVGW